MRKWILVGIFVVVFVSFVAVLTVSARRNSPYQRLQAEIERLKREGEPLSWSEIAPPVPKHLDGTSLYRRAFAQLEDAQKKVPPNAWITYSPQVLQTAGPALQTLRKAVEFPHMRLIDREKAATNFWSMMPFPQFSHFREFARLLCAEAEFHKRQGDIDKAVESCTVILKLARRIGDEPFLISFLVQRVVFNIGAARSWSVVLSDSEASTNAYRNVLRELQAWDIDRDFIRALKAERVISGIQFFDGYRKKEQSVLASLRALFGADQIELSFLLSPNGYLTGNQLLLLSCYRQLIAFAKKGAPYDFQALRNYLAQLQRKANQGWEFSIGRRKVSWRPYALVSILVPVYQSSFEVATQTHALQRVTEVALALRLYRAERGKYPDHLQELVPHYLPQVPIDPYDGKPIRYRKLQKGFKVWSVGGNRKDDGGVKVRDWWQRGDLVLESKI